MMNFSAVLDISIFVWSQVDFEVNKHNYYQLINLVPTVYKQIEDNRVPILLRRELYNLLISDFPYSSISEINSSYSTLTLSFLTRVSWTNYEDRGDSIISTKPNIVKEHFGVELIKELNSQMFHLLKNGVNGYKFIGYNYFHNYAENLFITVEANSMEVESLFYESEDEVARFFDKFKIKFRHNPKHNLYNVGGKISPLSCYNERTGNIMKAQNLLSTSYSLDNDYYNFDAENNVYVRFVYSNDGTFHGFDVSDEGNNIPNAIKRRFNKNGRKF